MQTAAVAEFAATLAVFYGAHAPADHWIQSDHQAVSKGKDGWVARRAALFHVLTYTAVIVVGMLALALRFDIHYDLPRVALALVFNGATHYVADRRAPLEKLATWRGKGSWLKFDPEAGYKLDQSWHITFLVVSAFIAV